jgi:hypothetical protein
MQSSLKQLKTELLKRLDIKDKEVGLSYNERQVMVLLGEEILKEESNNSGTKNIP